MLRRSGRYQWANKPPLGSRLDPGHPLTPYVQAFYLANEAGGKLCQDLTGQYPATISTPSWGADGSGSVLNIGGTSSYVASTSAFAIGAVPVSLAVWCTSPTAAPASVYAVQAGATATGSGIVLFTNSSGQMVFNYNGIGAVSSATLDTNPHMWVGTNNGTTANSALYQDGVKIASANKVLTSFSSSVMTLGNRGSGGAVWPGTISQVILWVGVALAAADVEQLFLERYAMIAPPAGR